MSAMSSPFRILRGVAGRCTSLVSRALVPLRFAGTGVRVHSSSWVAWRSDVDAGGGQVEIGPDCEIHPGAMLLAYGGNIRLGARCSVNPYCVLYGHGGLTIGEGVRIAAHVVIIPANHVVAEGDVPIVESGMQARGIRIDDHVWIGAGARILDGVHIGAHAVVGAGSVVTKSVPARATVAGVPARVIRQR